MKRLLLSLFRILPISAFCLFAFLHFGNESHGNVGSKSETGQFQASDFSEDIETFLSEIEELPPRERFDILRERMRTIPVAERDQRRRLVREADRAFRAMMAGPDHSESETDRPADNDWTFRSILNIGGQFLFSLHSSSKGISFWAGEGEGRHGVRIVRFHAEKKVLEIRIDESAQFLPLDSGMIRIADETVSEVEAVNEALHEFRREWTRAAEDLPQLFEFQDRLIELGLERHLLRRPPSGPDDRRPSLSERQSRDRELADEINLVLVRAIADARRHPLFAETEAEVIAAQLTRLTHSTVRSTVHGPTENER